MKKITTILLLFLVSFGFSQKSISKVLEKLNKKSVPYITVKELVNEKNYLLLDAREPKEYNVSHINTADNVGYNDFDSKAFKEKFKNLNDTIVVYCSIGVRSENIGEKLLKMGYTNVYNLYGGIFEWKNQGQSVIDTNNKETDKVHTYNKMWSKYLKSGIAIYE